MSSPPASIRFDNLVSQMKKDIEEAAKLCQEIRRNRHIGRVHTQLDALETTLSDGPNFIERESSKLNDLKKLDGGCGDDIVCSDFTSYAHEVEEINAKLECIARPPSHHRPSLHSSHSHSNSHHSHNSHSPSDVSHHKEIENPHFHDLRIKWETVRESILKSLAQMRLRLTGVIDVKVEKGGVMVDIGEVKVDEVMIDKEEVKGEKEEEEEHVLHHVETTTEIGHKVQEHLVEVTL